MWETFVGVLLGLFAWWALPFVIIIAIFIIVGVVMVIGKLATRGVRKQIREMPDHD